MLRGGPTFYLDHVAFPPKTAWLCKTLNLCMVSEANATALAEQWEKGGAK